VSGDLNYRVNVPKLGLDLVNYLLFSHLKSSYRFFFLIGKNFMFGVIKNVETLDVPIGRMGIVVCLPNLTAASHCRT